MTQKKPQRRTPLVVPDRATRLQEGQKSFLTLKYQCALLLSLIAFGLYANTLNHEYTVDDATVLASNHVTTQGVKAIPDIFASAYRSGFWKRQDSLYRPMSVATFAVEWQFWPNNPHPGHWINVVLYALTAWFLFVMLFTLFSREYAIPFFITLLFVTHPIHTEVVANIKSRDELLCLLFSVLAILTFLKSIDLKHVSLALLSSFCFLLALLSKESAITLLLIFPLVAYFFRITDLRRSVISSLPLVAAAVIYLGIRLLVLHGVSTFADILPMNNSLVTTDDFLIRKATAIFILGRYVWLLLVPYRLCFDYSFNQIPNRSFADGMVWLSLLLFGGACVYAISTFKKRNVIAFGILFFLITISIVSNLFVLIESVMAERFLYLPSLGFCMVLVLCLSTLFAITETHTASSIRTVLLANRTFAFLLLTVCLLYSAKTYSRNADWKDNFTLLAADVHTSPNSARIRYAYGSALLERARKEDDARLKQSYVDRSIEQLERSVGILSSYADALYHLGLAYKEKGDPARAVYYLEQARTHRQFTDVDLLMALGVSYGLNRQYEESIATLKAVVAIDPASAEGYNNLGVYYDEWGKTEESKQALNMAISLDARSDRGYYNLGNSLAHAGEFMEAIDQYKIALELNAGNVDALNNVGNSYAALKDYDNAIVWFRKALAVSPDSAKVLNNLGITYIVTGNRAEGEELVRRAQSKK